VCGAHDRLAAFLDGPGCPRRMFMAALWLGMPSVLIAGVVIGVRSYPFPAEGRPRCVVEVRVPESTGTWRIEAYDDAMAEAEALVKDDHFAAQGSLSICARAGPNGQRLVSMR
jgi:hypothetical protein